MELNEKYLQRACDAFASSRGITHRRVEVAIEAYLAEMFKPGPMMTLEPLEAIPQRDYRKELWIGVATAMGELTIAFDRANEALAAFDKVFPKENHHG